MCRAQQANAPPLTLILFRLKTKPFISAYTLSWDQLKGVVERFAPHNTALNGILGREVPQSPAFKYKPSYHRNSTLTQVIPSSDLPRSSTPLSINERSGHAELKPVLDPIFAFSPNRDTLGGTSYVILSANGNVLIDSPAWYNTIQDILEHYGGIRWLAFTHRGAMGKLSHIKQIQSHFKCDILVQEQEAYLLPNVQVTTFQHTFLLDSNNRMIWTPGHTPGSACFYHQMQGGKDAIKGVLFTGRHLLPNHQGQIQPLRVAKTFHWFRQLRSIQILRDSFTKDTLHFGCPGANTGFLRKKRTIPNLYQQLADIDLERLKTAQPGL